MVRPDDHNAQLIVKREPGVGDVVMPSAQNAVQPDPEGMVEDSEGEIHEIIVISSDDDEHEYIVLSDDEEEKDESGMGSWPQPIHDHATRNAMHPYRPRPYYGRPSWPRRKKASGNGGNPLPASNSPPPTNTHSTRRRKGKTWTRAELEKVLGAALSQVSRDQFADVVPGRSTGATYAVWLYKVKPALFKLLRDTDGGPEL